MLLQEPELTVQVVGAAVAQQPPHVGELDLGWVHDPHESGLSSQRLHERGQGLAPHGEERASGQRRGQDRGLLVGVDPVPMRSVRVVGPSGAGQAQQRDRLGGAGRGRVPRDAGREGVRGVHDRGVRLAPQVLTQTVDPPEPADAHVSLRQARARHPTC